MEKQDNNGWIRIESEKDLPEESGQYYVFTNDQKIYCIVWTGVMFLRDRHNETKNITHYQPIQKPLKPLY